MLQQVQQFRKLGEGFAMQHKDSEYLDEVEAELRTAVLEAIPLEDRLRGFAVLHVAAGSAIPQIWQGFCNATQRFEVLGRGGSGTQNSGAGGDSGQRAGSPGGRCGGGHRDIVQRCWPALKAATALEAHP
jgi:hypothetical protein